MTAGAGTSPRHTNLLPTTIDVTQTPRHMPYLPAGESHLFNPHALSLPEHPNLPPAIMQQIDAYIRQSLTTIDNHCQQKRSELIVHESVIQAQEKHFDICLTTQDARLREWQHQLEAKMTHLGATTHAILEKAEQQLHSMANHSHQNLQACMQVLKAQTLELHKASLMALQQETQEKFEDLQTDLENFRLTARTLQIVWAQESPYVPDDDDDVVTDMKAPMVEADGPLSPRTALSAGANPPIAPVAAASATPTQSPEQERHPHWNRLFPHVDIEAIMNGPRPHSRPPVSTLHNRHHDRSSVPPVQRLPASTIGGRPRRSLSRS